MGLCFKKVLNKCFFLYFRVIRYLPATSTRCQKLCLVVPYIALYPKYLAEKHSGEPKINGLVPLHVIKRSERLSNHFCLPPRIHTKHHEDIKRLYLTIGILHRVC